MSIDEPFSKAFLELFEAEVKVFASIRTLAEEVETLLQEDKPVQREDMQRLISAVFLRRPLWSRSIAEDMSYNVTSVRRWVTADSCPHRALWPQILLWLKTKANTELSGADYFRKK